MEVSRAASKGLVRIQYKYLVPLSVFPEIKLSGIVISNFLNIHVSMSDLYSQDRSVYFAAAK
jgi:hypothetical protein